MEQRVKLGVSGRFRVTLFDSDGSVEREFDWQDNLITNQGLDYLGQYNWSGSISNVRLYCAVGTGAANPQVTDTALSNEVMRTSSDGGHSSPSDRIEVVGDDVVARFYITRYFTFSNAYDLTEMMFSPTSDSGAFNRELFRDVNGNPIQISVIAGKQMKIEHELSVVTSREPVLGSLVVREYDAGLNPIGEESRAFTQTTFGSSWQVFTQVLQPNSSASLHYITSGSADTGQGSVPTHSLQLNVSPRTYSTGSYSRTKRATINTATGNRELFGLVVGDGASGVKSVFGSGFTKDNVHELVVEFSVSWDRS